MQQNWEADMRICLAFAFFMILGADGDISQRTVVVTEDFVTLSCIFCIWYPKLRAVSSSVADAGLQKHGHCEVLN